VSEGLIAQYEETAGLREEGPNLRKCQSKKPTWMEDFVCG